MDWFYNPSIALLQRLLYASLLVGWLAILLVPTLGLSGAGARTFVGVFALFAWIYAYTLLGMIVVRKGRSSLRWLGLTLVTGPIGVLIGSVMIARYSRLPLRSRWVTLAESDR